MADFGICSGDLIAFYFLFFLFWPAIINHDQSFWMLFCVCVCVCVGRDKWNFFFTISHKKNNDDYMGRVIFSRHHL
jgi:hypothetical protein